MKKQAEIDIDDFLACTEFALYFFEIQRKLAGKPWNRQPACALRCYLYRFRNQKVESLSKILPLKELACHLKAIDTKMRSNNPVKNLACLLAYFPYLFFVISVFKHARLRMMIRDIISDGISSLFKTKNFKKACKSISLLSIMIGTFHDNYDVDLNILKTCTLYAELFDEKGAMSACLRHIYQNKVLK